MKTLRSTAKLPLYLYCAASILVFLTLFAVSGFQLGKTNPESRTYADFIGYYRSGKIVLSSDRGKIYDRQVQLDYFNSLNAARHSEEFIYSQNPPFFFILVAPFALLPLELSFKLWVMLSVLAAGLALHFLRKLLDEGTIAAGSLLLTTCALISAPGWICIVVGQMSWYMLLFCTIFSIGLLSRKDFLTGIGLALIACKFQYSFLLGLPLLALKRWKAVGYAIGCGLFLLLISALVLGPENLINYPKLLAEAETTHDYSGVFPEHMISLRGVLSLFLSRQAALSTSTALMFLSLIPLFLFWKDKGIDGSKARLAWAISVTVCSSLVFSAHTHIYDELLLALPAALTISLAKPAKCSGSGESSKDCPLRSYPAARIWKYLLVFLPFFSWFLFIFCNYMHTLKRTPFAALNLILLLCSLLCYYQQKKHEEQRGQNTP